MGLATRSASLPGMNDSLETATLAGGCFWCLDAILRELRGVEHVSSGYTGGHTVDPTYHDVCGGATGHAEVVRVEFDPGVIDFRGILEVFFATHDPTTLDRQGADSGTQYRSAIFFHSQEQETQARASCAEQGASRRFRDPIVTEIAAATVFTPAHEDHQRYLEKRGAVPRTNLSAAS